MYKKSKILIAALSLITLLNGCKNSINLRKPAPDEYTVVTYPSLDVPPNLSTLPTPGKSKILNSSDDISIKGSDKNDKNYSADTQVFLKHIDGNDEKNESKSIREDLDNEYIKLQEEEQERGIVGKIIDRDKYKDDPVIDPVAEKKRIEGNLKENQPINEGEVVEKSTKNKGLLNELISG